MCLSVIFKFIFSPSSIYHNSTGTESVQLQMTAAVGEYSVQYPEVPSSPLGIYQNLVEHLMQAAHDLWLETWHKGRTST